MREIRIGFVFLILVIWQKDFKIFGVVGTRCVEFEFFNQLLGLQLPDLFRGDHGNVHVGRISGKRIGDQHNLHTFVLRELQGRDKTFRRLCVRLLVFIGGIGIPADGVARVIAVLSVGIGSLRYGSHHQGGSALIGPLFGGLVHVFHHVVLHALALFVKA